MKRRSLDERMLALQQQKAKLEAHEAKLKLEARKARTRRLIEMGGLVEKAGLSGLASNALLGALLEIAQGADNSLTLTRWADRGGKVFNRERAEMEDARNAPSEVLAAD